MEKKKVYAVVCSYYIEDGTTLDIDLDDKLRHLVAKPSESWGGYDYGAKRVVQWNFDNCLKVKYKESVRYVYEDQIDILSKPFSFYQSRDDASKFAKYLNDFHDSLFVHITDEEADIIFRNYGYSYRDQTKRRG